MEMVTCWMTLLKVNINLLVMLMTCVIKNDDKYYPQLYLEEALYMK